MKKIRITEKDLQEMVFNGVKKILKEEVGRENNYWLLSSVGEDEIREDIKKGGYKYIEYDLSEEWDNIIDSDTADMIFDRYEGDTDLKGYILYSLEEGYSDMSPEAKAIKFPSFYMFYLNNPEFENFLKQDSEINRRVMRSIYLYLNNQEIFEKIIEDSQRGIRF